MATHTNLESLFTNIANAIREKNNSVSKITADNFPIEIANIPTGVDTSDATAGASQILTGYSAYVKGSKVNGNMANNGAISSTLTADGNSYTIPAGYHNGNGKVAVSLASKGYQILYGEGNGGSASSNGTYDWEGVEVGPLGFTPRGIIAFSLNYGGTNIPLSNRDVINAFVAVRGETTATISNPFGNSDKSIFDISDEEVALSEDSDDTSADIIVQWNYVRDSLAFGAGVSSSFTMDCVDSDWYYIVWGD